MSARVSRHCRSIWRVHKQRYHFYCSILALKLSMTRRVRTVLSRVSLTTDFYSRDHQNCFPRIASRRKEFAHAFSCQFFAFLLSRLFFIVYTCQRHKIFRAAILPITTVSMLNLFHVLWQIKTTIINKAYLCRKVWRNSVVALAAGGGG